MFKEINIRDINKNFVKSIADEWMLISAGDEKAANMMTASWGMIGELWNKDVVCCFIRPQRHTLGFVENSDTFALSFFGKNYKKELSFCGTKSGRDYDKIKETGLTPLYDCKTIAFDEAETIIFCKKLAVSEFTPDMFLDTSIDEKNYPEKDYHKIFIGEIIKVIVKE